MTERRREIAELRCVMCDAPATWEGVYTDNTYCDTHGSDLIGVQRISTRGAGHD